MLTDPIADMLTRLKNASRARKDTAVIPHSKEKLAILQILQGAGYVGEITRRGKRVKKRLEVELKYDEGGVPRIEAARRVSRPGQRVYARARTLRSSRRHRRGIAVLSTPQGIQTDEQARKANVGGEVLCEVF
ncbi:30S ribosomal protein S8 [Candidatus Parcubacteria bacterium]|nr:30S ribosomal protein S8 [Candidatus Parcubacteria bacterium]MBI4098969.1 30S ribosomal protein S8 [Candidatus Parcubacteria bacterium]MBI4385330.1 30S ribosomal protein S8 [Candidatus Parcubacteria bacterium]